MSNPVQRFNQMKQQVEELQRRIHQAEGSQSQIMSRLEEEFGCSTLKAAKTEITRLRKQESLLAKEFEAAEEDFEKEWTEEDEND